MYCYTIHTKTKIPGKLNLQSAKSPTFHPPLLISWLGSFASRVVVRLSPTAPEPPAMSDFSLAAALGGDGAASGEPAPAANADAAAAPAPAGAAAEAPPERKRKSRWGSDPAPAPAPAADGAAASGKKKSRWGGESVSR